TFYVEKATPSLLLTNLTSDVDGIKSFVSQALVSIVAAVFSIIGASILLLSINWKLGIAVLMLIPIIAYVFYTAFSKIGGLFGKGQGIIDRLNGVIGGTIIGAALIRVVNAKHTEIDKFIGANSAARDNGLAITALFASLIPTVMFVANAATIVILLLGGHFVIGGTMTLGEFAAFNSYITILIFPIFIIGFMSGIIGRAQASFKRVKEIFDLEPVPEEGTSDQIISGNIEVKDVSLVLGEKTVLDTIDFTITPGSKNAIIGPTAAGKTQLLYLLTGLVKPEKGEILYDGISIQAFKKTSFHNQVGFVFQDSVMFNLTIRENIAFSKEVSSEALTKAIEAAELAPFVASLPNGLETHVSERGTSLSGGQKQRIMLARALALNPKVLILDDFTARVDAQTEARIIANIDRLYPGITLISVTQKIAPIMSYDHIIVLMEGELIASGTHEYLMKHAPEYVQIFDSQQSTMQLEKDHEK
ncbi:MAG: hypothetical protein RLY57_506, partial [Candidatus Parcubacteria bacterium]